MTRLVILIAVVLAAWSPEPENSSAVPHPVPGNAGTAEPEGTCWGIEPICPPGRSPICLCESDYSLRCEWVCGSVGR